MSSHRKRKFAAGVTALLAVTGCAVKDINLVEDRRIHVDAPHDQQMVRLPVTLRWSTRGVAPGLTYAVFLDRPPIRPGKTLKSLAKDAEDDACMARPDCPDAAWLAGRGVYLTKNRSLVLSALADRRPENRPKARDGHEAVIVLLNGTRRVGESSWYRQFYIERGR